MKSNNNQKSLFFIDLLAIKELFNLIKYMLLKFTSKLLFINLNFIELNFNILFIYFINEYILIKF